ncbi:MAG: hypothetical protein JWQ46_1807 [Phenylobacterium sp.]|jgi:CelD/BcsL family acetyltransferase involved in cellulose biosynthesis|nr:hypothetical protein [Phenylobacterium sp.]
MDRRDGGGSRQGEAPPASLSIEEITDPVGLEALRADWSELFHATPAASPFQSPDWLLPWRRRFLAEGLWTLAIRRDGRLVGLAPLFIHRRQVTLLGNGISDRLDLLARPGWEAQVAEAVLAHMERRSDLWDSCDFRDLPPHAVLLRAPWRGPGADTSEPDEPCRVLQLPDRAEAVIDALPAKLRQNLRNRARRAAQAGAVAFESADAAGLDPAVDALLHLHRRRWRAKGEDGVLTDAAVEAFHRDAAPGLLRQRLLRLNLMRLDGRVIAAQYLLVRGETACSYINGFDPHYAALAPGALLLRFSVEQSVREGACAFDFLRGREAYKAEWGAVEQPQFRRRIRR